MQIRIFRFVVDTNLKTVYILGVTFDLDKNIYKPYQKPNNKAPSKLEPSSKYFKTAAEINCQAYTRNIVQ